MLHLKIGRINQKEGEIMGYQNFQEAIAQLATDEGMNSEEIKSKFDLNEDDMMAIKSHDSLIQAMTPRPTILCCCCM